MFLAVARYVTLNGQCCMQLVSQWRGETSCTKIRDMPRDSAFSHILSYFEVTLVVVTLGLFFTTVNIVYHS